LKPLAITPSRGAPAPLSVSCRRCATQLDDQSPARLLREGDIDEVGPEIIAAERAFLVGG
jgi:hypothetical protein